MGRAHTLHNKLILLNHADSVAIHNFTNLLLHIFFLIFNNCQLCNWSNLVLIVIYLIFIYNY